VSLVEGPQQIEGPIVWTGPVNQGEKPVTLHGDAKVSSTVLPIAKKDCPLHANGFVLIEGKLGNPSSNPQPQSTLLRSS